MFIVHVFVHVKPEYVADFKTATIANAQGSIQEPGIARFDFLEQQDDPNRFVLVEVYRRRKMPRSTKRPRTISSGATPWKT
jgi:autoinducer 2-degrading protein